MNANPKSIRKCVFETNSSSSHSLTISKGDLVKQPFRPDMMRQGTIDVMVGEYGWEYYRYYTPLEKIRYLLTQISNGKPAELDSEDDRLKQLRRVVMDFTGCELQIVDSEGYVDHDSEGVGMELFESDGKLKDFLFSENSYIETSNDNSGAPWRIDTDRGPELYYAEHIEPIPKTYVDVVLMPVDRWSNDRLITANGALLSETFNGDIFKKILKKGIVDRADWKCQGDYDYFEHSDVKIDSISRVVCRDGCVGFKVSPSFGASRTFKKIAKGDKFEKVSLKVFVPKTLAAELKSLEKTPEVLIDLDKAAENLTHWKKRSCEAEATEYEHEAYAKAQALFDKLTADAQSLKVV